MTRPPSCAGIRVQVSRDSKSSNVLAHERLAIVDPLQGAQPLQDRSGRVVLSVNGEIWNHEDLRTLVPDYPFMTASDCEPVIPLFLEQGEHFVQQLDGIFALVISVADGDAFAARDAIGVMPLYVGHKDDGSIWFASELKALVGHVERIDDFPPGHYWSSKSDTFVRWYNPPWMDLAFVPDTPVDLLRLRQALQASVVKRLMTDVP